MKKIFYSLLICISLLFISSCDNTQHLEKIYFNHYTINLKTSIEPLDQSFGFTNNNDTQYHILEDAKTEVDMLKDVIEILSELDNNINEEAKQFLDSLEPEINNIFIVRRNEVNRDVKYFTEEKTDQLGNNIYIELDSIISEDIYVYYDILIVPKTFGTNFKIVKK